MTLEALPAQFNKRINKRIKTRKKNLASQIVIMPKKDEYYGNSFKHYGISRKSFRRMGNMLNQLNSVNIGGR